MVLSATIKFPLPYWALVIVRFKWKFFHDASYDAFKGFLARH